MRFLIALLLIQLNLSAKELRVSFGNALPPWIMPETNEGILLDILKTCLEPEGYTIVPVYHPYARRLREYRYGSIDIVSDINENIIQKEKLEGSFSGYIYAYENFAYSLSKNNYRFSKISELGAYSLLSWQGAINHLGGEYAKMAKSNERYAETPRQNSQVQMLFLGRYNVIQMDSNIFEYYKAKIEKAGEINTKVSYDKFALFGKSPNGYMFKDKKVKEDFLKNLEKFKHLKKFKGVLFDF